MEANLNKNPSVNGYENNSSQEVSVEMNQISTNGYCMDRDVVIKNEDNDAASDPDPDTVRADDFGESGHESNVYQIHTLDGDKNELRYRVWLRAKIVGLSVVTVIVWCLLLLPVVIYYIPVVSRYIEPMQ